MPLSDCLAALQQAGAPSSSLAPGARSSPSQARQLPQLKLHLRSRQPGPKYGRVTCQLPTRSQDLAGVGKGQAASSAGERWEGMATFSAGWHSYAFKSMIRSRFSISAVPNKGKEEPDKDEEPEEVKESKVLRPPASRRPAEGIVPRRRGHQGREH